MLKEITVASAVVALFVLSGCGGGDGNPGGGGVIIHQKIQV